MLNWRKGAMMAKRKRLEAPGPAELADLEAGFAAKQPPERTGLTAPIAQIAGEIARVAEPLDIEKRVSNARDSLDADAWRQASAQGRVITDLALDRIDLDYMLRDRIVVDPSELQELKSSILSHGLRLPVEVVALEDGTYGLVSGWRRVTAMRQLQQDDPTRFATIKAIIRPPYEAAALYTAMVEENELRSQVTPYERGRIAVVAASTGAFFDTDAAIETIFATASKAKRSKIRSFAQVHDALGDVLQFPTDLSERNGLRLSYALREGFADALRAALQGAQHSGPAQEWAMLEPVVAAAEAALRNRERGGRPKTRKPANIPAKGVTIEHIRHEDGFSIRLRGAAADPTLVDPLIDQLRDWLARLPD